MKEVMGGHDDHIERESLGHEYDEPWIETYTGTAFKILNPDWRDVHLVDIAHSLSNQCRFNGHTHSFYSVAEHSVVIGREVKKDGGSDKEALAALLHDAGEAYIGDMPSPVKAVIPEFKVIEKRIEAAIAKKFDLIPMPAYVKNYDTRILVDERAQTMPQSTNMWGIDGLTGVGVKLELWSPEEARMKFLTDALRYMGR